MIKKQAECGDNMSRVLLLNAEPELVEKALAEHHVNKVFVALDETVENRHMAKRLGLGRYALVGADANPSAYDLVLPAPAPKKSKSKKALEKEVEAVADESTDEVLS